jgi:hypothetical protein
MLPLTISVAILDEHTGLANLEANTPLYAAFGTAGVHSFLNRLLILTPHQEQPTTNNQQPPFTPHLVLAGSIKKRSFFSP